MVPIPTPLTRLKTDRFGTIFIKHEEHNPSGSVKDRMVPYVLQQMISSGRLKPEGMIVEASSGNTGAAIACAAKAYRLKVLIFMSDTTSPAKIENIRQYGAEVRLIDTSCRAGLEISAAREFAAANGAVYFNQFENPYHLEGYRNTIAKELVAQLASEGVVIDGYIGGVGTGATLISVGEELRETHNRNLKITAVFPATFPTDIEGIHPGHAVPDGHFSIWRNRPAAFEDSSCFVENREAYSSLIELMDSGIEAGPATGASFWAAKRFAQGGNVLVIATDHGRRYAEKIEKWKREIT